MDLSFQREYIKGPSKAKEALADPFKGLRTSRKQKNLSWPNKLFMVGENLQILNASKLISS